MKATILCSSTMFEDPLARKTVENTTRSSPQQAICPHQFSDWAGLEPSLLAWESGNHKCDHPVL